MYATVRSLRGVSGSFTPRANTSCGFLDAVWGFHPFGFALAPCNLAIALLKLFLALFDLASVLLSLAKAPFPLPPVLCDLGLARLVWAWPFLARPRFKIFGRMFSLAMAFFKLSDLVKFGPRTVKFSLGTI